MVGESGRSPQGVEVRCFISLCQLAQVQKHPAPVVVAEEKVVCPELALETPKVIEEKLLAVPNEDLLISDPRKITILVVDNKPTNRQALQNQLAMVGY